MLGFLSAFSFAILSGGALLQVCTKIYQIDSHLQFINGKRENSVSWIQCPFRSNEDGWIFHNVYSWYRLILCFDGKNYNAFAEAARRWSVDDWVAAMTNQMGEPEENDFWEQWYKDTKAEFDAATGWLQSRLPPGQNALSLISNALKTAGTKETFLCLGRSPTWDYLTVSDNPFEDCREFGVCYLLNFRINRTWQPGQYVFRGAYLHWKSKDLYEILCHYWQPVFFWETKIDVPSFSETLVVKDYVRNLEKQMGEYIFRIKYKDLLSYLEIDHRSYNTTIRTEGYSDIYLNFLNPNGKHSKVLLTYKFKMKLLKSTPCEF